MIFINCMHSINKYCCRCKYDYVEFLPVNPADTSIISVTKNGLNVNTFFNYRYCGGGSYSRALEIDSEYEVRGVESLKIVFRSDSYANFKGFLIGYSYY